MVARAARIINIAVLLGVMAAPAKSQEIDFDHVIAVAGSQAAASQTMASEALLIALDIDRANRLENLNYLLEPFDRTLSGLRNGDPSLGLPVAPTPEIARELETAALHWQSTRAALQDALASGIISADQIAVIAADSVALTDAFEGIAAGYADVAATNRLTSMLANAVLESIHGTALSQRMATEYLLIVYRQDVHRNRASLGRTVVEFDQILANLLNGNLERRLLPPPNDDVRSRLLRAKRVWEDEFRPIIRRALDDEPPPPSSAIALIQANSNLLEQLTATTDMYVSL